MGLDCSMEIPALQSLGGREGGVGGRSSGNKAADDDEEVCQ